MLGTKYLDSWTEKRQLKADNLMEYLIYDGIQQEAVLILEEDYGVEIKEWEGKVSLDCTGIYSRHTIELIEIMVNEDICFEYNPNCLDLTITEFTQLCDELLKEE